MGCGKFRGGEGDSRKRVLVRVDDVLGNLHVEQRSVRGKRALVLILVTMRSDQVRTIRGTVDGNFALRAAADGADFLALGGAKSFGFAFFTDRTGHSGSPRDERKLAEYSRDDEKPKSRKAKTPKRQNCGAPSFDRRSG